MTTNVPPQFAPGFGTTQAPMQYQGYMGPSVAPMPAFTPIANWQGGTGSSIGVDTPYNPYGLGAFLGLNLSGPNGSGSATGIATGGPNTNPSVLPPVQPAFTALPAGTSTGLPTGPGNGRYSDGAGREYEGGRSYGRDMAGR